MVYTRLDVKHFKKLIMNSQLKLLEHPNQLFRQSITVSQSTMRHWGKMRQMEKVGPVLKKRWWCQSTCILSHLEKLRLWVGLVSDVSCVSLGLFILTHALPPLHTHTYGKPTVLSALITLSVTHQNISFIHSSLLIYLIYSNPKISLLFLHLHHCFVFCNPLQFC